MGTDGPCWGSRLHTHTVLLHWGHVLADAAPEPAPAEHSMRPEARAATGSARPRRRSALSLEAALTGGQLRLGAADASCLGPGLQLALGPWSQHLERVLQPRDPCSPRTLFHCWWCTRTPGWLPILRIRGAGPMYPAHFRGPRAGPRVTALARPPGPRRAPRPRIATAGVTGLCLFLRHVLLSSDHEEHDAHVQDARNRGLVLELPDWREAGHLGKAAGPRAWAARLAPGAWVRPQPPSPRLPFLFLSSGGSFSFSAALETLSVDRC